MKCGLFDLFFLNSANLAYPGTDISKYFRESLGLRDNGSRLNIRYATGVSSRRLFLMSSLYVGMQTGSKKNTSIGIYFNSVVSLWRVASRKHTYIILTPLNPTFI